MKKELNISIIVKRKSKRGIKLSKGTEDVFKTLLLQNKSGVFDNIDEVDSRDKSEELRQSDLDMQLQSIENIENLIDERKG